MEDITIHFAVPKKNKVCPVARVPASDFYLIASGEFSVRRRRINIGHSPEAYGVYTSLETQASQGFYFLVIFRINHEPPYLVWFLI